MMKLLRISLMILSSILFLSGQYKAQAAETVFFESLYDVPVMVGMTEVKDMSLSFDKAEGRIAYAAALSENISEDKILGFYSKVLSQMGWEEITPNSFIREQEKLEISFEKTTENIGASALVKFSLSPNLK